MVEADPSRNYKLLAIVSPAPDAAIRQRSGMVEATS
jgi:hypothetical protein